MLVMMYSREALAKKTAKDLLVIAKELVIVGRHDMRKDELINAIVSKLAVEAMEAESKVVTKSCTSVVKNTNTRTFEHDLAIGHKEEWDNTPLKKCDERRPRDAYINNAKVGTLIAFKVNDTKALSGKIEAISKNSFEVRTKSGVKFTVKKSNVMWVKTTDRWPSGVYHALRGETHCGKLEATN